MSAARKILAVFMTYQKVSASGLVFNQQGKFLMLKRAENDDFLPGAFALPGGGTDYMEDPIKGLEREIKEECGIDAKVLHPLTAFSFKMNHEGVDKHTVEIIYLCEFDEKQPISLSFEHSDYKWVGFDEALTLPNSDYFMKVIADLQNHPLIQTH